MKGKNESAKKIFSIVFTVAFICLMTAAIIPGVMGTSIVDLGSADNYAILAKTAITTTGTTHVTGDIGISPATATALTGFGLIMDPSGEFSTSTYVVGRVYASDYAVPTPSRMTIAISDMEMAYTDASTRPSPDFTDVGTIGGDIGGMTLYPGLYKFTTAAVTISNDVNLSGSTNDVWIFQIPGTLDISSGKHIILSSGAQEQNIFWVVGGATTLGTTSVFEGNILDKTAITLNTGATLNGRALAQSAVTVGGSTVAFPVVTAPVANFAGTPTLGTARLTVTFTDSTTNGPTVWQWNFGDGSIVNASNQNPVHTYLEPGTYTVTLTASNAGGSNTLTRTNYIVVSAAAIPAPVAGFTGTPLSGTAPLTVTFTDTTTNGPTIWQWNFGDGTTDTVKNPVHIYQAPGSYTVTLTASNAGGSSTVTQMNYIVVSAAAIPAPVAGFTGTPTLGTAPLTVTFTDTTTNGPTVWQWNFGDGTTGTVKNPVHIYQAPGTYTVTLTASNAGGSSTATQMNYIVVSAAAIPAPASGFTGTPTSGTAPLTVTFTDTTTNGPTIWQWNFGDGTADTVKNPVHIYQAPGTYTVTLTASNAGGSSAATQMNYIVVSTAAIPAPVSGFTGTPTLGTAPLTVTFTDTTTNGPTIWQWNFGDGSIVNATVKNPVHAYLSPGTYTVTLTASNAGGSSAVTRSSYIAVSAAAITPPTASFTGTPTLGTAPLTVTFTDTTTNGPTIWQWNFGDSSIVNATVKNPVHAYLSPGTYTVTLTASNAGGSSTATRSSYIAVSAATITPPTASFSGTPTSGTAPLTVTFTDTTTNVPTIWQWNFGDGTTDTVKNPVHIYQAPGTYTVTLTASNAGGSSTATRSSYIVVSAAQITPPTASFTGTPTSGTAPLTVTFTDLSINAPTVWQWNFGDGTTDTVRSPVHIYQAPGTYTVTLTASNAGGSSAATQMNYIVVSAAAITPPTASFTGTPTLGTAPLTVTFTDTTTNGPTIWQWNFGDGTTDTVKSPVHIYQAPGTYTVTLTASNAGGSSAATRSSYIVVSAAQITPPTASFTGTPTLGTAPLTVTFTDTTTNGPTIWQWNFGDGSIVNATVKNPIHTYLAPGTYTVTLTASNAGGSNTLTRTNYIVVSAATITPPTASFTGTPISGTAPRTVTFTDTTTNGPTIWQWNFGDGTTGSVQSPVHTYMAPGSYTVTLTASNAGGSSAATRSSYIAVSAAAITPPTASFTGTPTLGTAPLTVTFTDTTTNGPTIWQWNFGDGTTGSVQSPVHTYMAPGTYTVTLTASNAGGSNTLTRTNYIAVSVAQITPPTASFTGTPLSGTAPLTVTFTDTTTNGPTIWQWNFGDGTTGSVQSPVHSYLAPGTYTVTLTASNAGGSNTFTRTNYIAVSAAQITPPTVSFTGTPISGTAPRTVTFIDLSINAPTVWQWNFGDGAFDTVQNPIHTYLSPGTYTVTLTASNAGGSNTLTRTNYIAVSAAQITPPTASFTGTPTSGTAPLTVTFTDTTTNSPTVWQWNFGDGSSVNSTVRNPVHSYLAPGTYTVTLTASNAGGSSAATRTSYIAVSGVMIPVPVAGFTGTPTSGTAPLEVTFTDSTTNSPTVWQWNFGDGSSENSTVKNPVHIYQAPGSYTVTLTASNAGGSSTATKTSYIAVSGAMIPVPVADFTGTPPSGTAPLTVMFTDSTTNGPTVWQWNFGDNTTATVQNPVHAYLSPGAYTVSLTASNAGGSSTVTKTSYIAVSGAMIPAPVAGFTGTPSSGTAPLTVTFTDSTTNSPTVWQWNFGDGNTTNSAVQNPVHTYLAPGTYTVTLTASNAGGSSTSTRTNYIAVSGAMIPVPVAGFTGTPSSGTAPLTVTFTDSTINVPTIWQWNFGDGSSENSTVKNPVHTYLAPGTYTVTLTASNAGGSSTATKTSYITMSGAMIPAPVAGFTGTPLSGTAPLTVTFTDSTTNGPTVWQWNFGDGSSVNSTVKNPVHVYLNSGTYTVSLTASNAGGSSTAIRTSYIAVSGAMIPAPVAGFTGTPPSGTAPLTVTFTDSTTNGPAVWQWNFGDNTTDTVQNPVHVYLNPGTYTVSLTASNAGGSSTATKTSYIAVSGAMTPAPVAGFTGTPPSGTAPLTVTFTDSTTNGPAVWQWNFGDGSSVNSTVKNPVHVYLNPGTYTVSLTASNTGGSSTATKTSYIAVSGAMTPAPVAGFAGTPPSGTAPLTVTFTDTTTKVPTIWQWNFGDGSSVNSTVKNPVHVYLNPGTYTVSLTASNTGGSSTATKTSYIAVSGAMTPAPVAGFTGTPPSGTAPLTVTFTDTTTNVPTIWQWNFGDNTTDTVQNPVHTYLASGTYTVTLTASNAGGSSTSTRMSYIAVSGAMTPAPVAGFTGTPPSGTAPLTVTFTDTTTNGPTVWQWNFGDSSSVNSTVKSPVHTYLAPGTYTVTLTASNAGGSSTATRTSYIVVSAAPINPPTSSFTGTPTSGTAPLTVTFTDTTTNSPTIWQWNFGDGSSVNSTVKNPVHAYLSPGTYTVSLTASNAGGSNTSTRTRYITVSGAMIPAPVAGFTGTPTSGTAPLTVTFTDTTTNSPTVWQWNFGDGSSVNSTVKSPVHTYLAPGTYTVTLTASNAGGSNTSTRTSYIVVSGSMIPVPVAGFTGTPTSGTTPLTVMFTDSTTNGPTVWQWNFGDGSSENSTVKNPVHTYLAPGTYTVTLTASNAGGSNTATRTSYIVVSGSMIPVPVAGFTGTPTSGTAPLTVMFTDSTTNGPTVWQWNFGDGSSVNSTVKSPVHTYLAPGTYTVTLTASNAGGSNTSTRTSYIAVSGAMIPVPVAGFTGTPPSGTAPLTVTFTDSTTNGPTVWQWNFGDGTTDTVQNPVHAFLSPGTYTVTLTASNAGGSSTATKTSYIAVSGAMVPVPVAGFTGTPPSGTAPLTVTFTDSTTNGPTVWQWNFGDGTTDTVQNPVHAYLSPGTYTVTLTASNAGGSSTATKTSYIAVSGVMIPEPVAGFTGTPHSGTAPQTVTFTDSTTNVPTIWEWNFGDGSSVNSTVQNPVHAFLSPGTYTVTLTASNAGGSSTATKTSYIAVSGAMIPEPVAGFTGTPPSGTAPLTVTFTDSTTNGPTVWQWNFGDDTTDTVQNPVHAFLSPGTYTVTLTASNAGGSSTATKTSYIAVSGAMIPEPVAGFTGTPHSGTTPLTVTFTDSTTNGPTVWQWNFGDDTTDTVQNPVHAYLRPGTNTVTLTASNAGGSSTATKTGYIAVTAAAGPTNVDLGLAGNYAILAKSGISTTGTTSIVGDIGVSPIDATAITGFDLSMDPSNQFSTSPLVAGRVYAADYASPTPAILTTAISNMETAYSDAAGRVPPDATELYSGNLGGKTLAPGVYKWSTDVLIPSSTDLTLDAQGNENAVWIFQVAQGLTMNYASRVVLINGAKAENVYWQIAGDAGVTIGTGSNAEGNILAAKAITMDSGTSLNGRALAQTAVTLIENTVTNPTDTALNPVGVFRGGVFYLKDATDIVYGLSTDTPVIGDWNGDLKSEVGVFRGGVFYLRNTDGSTTTIVYGLPTDTPVIGDWNGDLKSEVGVFRGGVFYRNGADPIVFGLPTDTPVTGDWNGDHLFGVGVWRSNNDSGTFYIRNWDSSTTTIWYGYSTDTPVIGDWNEDLKSEVGVWRNSAGSVFYLRDSAFQTTITPYGLPTDTPIAGKWTG